MEEHMAGSVNKVILIGNLGRDPEVRSFQNGGKVCNLRIATSENWKDKNTGERREKTEWHSVAIFQEGLVRIAEQYLRKGSKVYIEGQLQTRKWQDQSGQDKYSTEVVLQAMITGRMAAMTVGMTAAIAAALRKGAGPRPRRAIWTMKFRFKRVETPWHILGDKCRRQQQMGGLSPF